MIVNCLTATQLKVCRLVAEGCTDKEAGVRLGISGNTVKVHLRSAYQKLGINSRMDLVVAFAGELGESSPGEPDQPPPGTLADLSPEDREIVRMVVEDGLSQAEVARRLNQHYSEVKKRFMEARRILGARNRIHMAALWYAQAHKTREPEPA